MQLFAIDPAAKFHTIDDVAPLVRTTHLQNAAVAARQLEKIIGLQDHVVEFEKSQRLFTLEPELHRIKGHHAVDGEMHPIVAQEADVVEVIEPVGIVDHHRVTGT